MTTALHLLKQADKILENEESWTKWQFCGIAGSPGNARMSLSDLADSRVTCRCLVGALLTAAHEAFPDLPLEQQYLHPNPEVTLAMEELISSIYDEPAYGTHDLAGEYVGHQEYEYYRGLDLVSHFNDRFQTRFEDVKSLLKETIDRLEKKSDEQAQV